MKLSASINAYISDTPTSVGNVYEKHCHTGYELIYLLKGSVQINFEGEKAVLTEQDVILFPPLCYHVVSGRGTEYSRLILSFSPDDVPPQIKELFASGVKAMPIRRDKELSAVLSRLSKIVEAESELYRPLANSLLTEIFYFYIHSDASVQKSERKETEMVKDTVAYIDSRLDSVITIKELAGRLYCSESTLNHIFKKEMNIPIRHYILDKKMAYAKANLKNGVTPLECANLCGYRNYAAFYKIFLKSTGCAPSAYLMKKQKTLDNTF